eukprot:7804401-Alexandrium_andersonii.AAC.1
MLGNDLVDGVPVHLAEAHGADVGAGGADAARELRWDIVVGASISPRSTAPTWAPAVPMPHESS